MRVRRVGRPADRRVDDPARRVEAAPDQREVATLDVASARARRRARRTRVRAGDDHEPARVAVEPVHDAGPGRVADVGELGEPLRAGRSRACRRHDRRPGARRARRACRRRSRRRRRSGRRPGRARGREAGRAPAPRAARRPRRLEPVALGHGLPVDEHGAVVDEAGDLGPAPPGERGERPVDPLPRQRRRHRQLAHAARLIRGPGARRGRASPRPGGDAPRS